MPGIELAAPSLVVEIPATLLENSNASTIFNDLANATLKAPLNASPAPVVSFTSSFNLCASTK